MAIFPPWHMLLSIISRKAAEVAAHLEADIEALVHVEFALHIGEFLARHIHHAIRAERLGQREAMLIDVRDHDVARSRVPHDRSGHATDRIARAGDEHILAKYIERQRRVYRIAQRVEDARHVAIDAGSVVPHIRHGQRNVFRKRARPVYAYTLGVRAKMTPPGKTIPAAPADHMAFAADDFTGKEIGDVRPDLDDLADKFMTHDHRHGNRPLHAHASHL